MPQVRSRTAQLCQNATERAALTAPVRLRVDVVREEPPVFIVHDFATEEECECVPPRAPPPPPPPPPPPCPSLTRTVRVRGGGRRRHALATLMARRGPEHRLLPPAGI